MVKFMRSQTFPRGFPYASKASACICKTLLQDTSICTKISFTRLLLDDTPALQRPP